MPNGSNRVAPGNRLVGKNRSRNPHESPHHSDANPAAEPADPAPLSVAPNPGPRPDADEIKRAVMAKFAQLAAEEPSPANRVNSPPAVMLPQHSEPLAAIEPVLPSSPSLPETTPLPRARALARPSIGLVAAIANWLYSARKLLAYNVLPRQPRASLPKPPRAAPSPRAMLLSDAAEELARLKRENARLRSQMEALATLNQARNAKIEDPVLPA